MIFGTQKEEGLKEQKVDTSAQAEPSKDVKVIQSRQRKVRKRTFAIEVILKTNTAGLKKDSDLVEFLDISLKNLEDLKAGRADLKPDHLVKLRYICPKMDLERLVSLVAENNEQQAYQAISKILTEDSSKGR